MKVAVLMGGWSAEREVSLTSGRGIAQACRTLGHDVTEIDMGRDVAQRGGKLPALGWLPAERQRSGKGRGLRRTLAVERQ